MEEVPGFGLMVGECAHAGWLLLDGGWARHASPLRGFGGRMVIRSYVLAVVMLPGMLMRWDVFRLAVALLLVVLQ